MPQPAYKRILLKLSGEALMGDDAYGINRATIVRMVREVQEITALGCEVAVVIGGGNIFRGVAGGSVGMDRATADYMGMLATVMNALALADTMRQEGMTARVMSAISIEQVVDKVMALVGKQVRKTVKQFDIEGTPCDQLGSLLVNDVTECKAPGGPVDGCLAGLNLTTLTKVQLSK